MVIIIIFFFLFYHSRICSSDEIVPDLTVISANLLRFPSDLLETSVDPDVEYHRQQQQQQQNGDLPSDPNTPTPLCNQNFHPNATSTTTRSTLSSPEPSESDMVRIYNPPPPSNHQAANRSSLASPSQPVSASSFLDNGTNGRVCVTL